MSLKNLTPIIVTVLTGILAAFTPSITAWVTAHPDTAVLIGTIGSAMLHALESPLAPKA